MLSDLTWPLCTPPCHHHPKPDCVLMSFLGNESWAMTSFIWASDQGQRLLWTFVGQLEGLLVVVWCGGLNTGVVVVHSNEGSLLVGCGSVKNHWKSLLPLWVVHLLLYGGGGGSGGQDFPQSLSVTILTSPRRAVTRIYRFHPFLFSLFLSSSLDFSLSLRHISTHLMSSGDFAFQ